MPRGRSILTMEGGGVVKLSLKRCFDSGYHGMSF